MQNDNRYEVIIIGGSYAGLSAAMALARALRKVLVIDSGKPCNRYTPRSHNFITHDGSVPSEIAALAKQQVSKYTNVSFSSDVVLKGTKDGSNFVLSTQAGLTLYAPKIICASGIKDIMHNIPGLEECWGRTVLHCPYCHGYEVRGRKTGVLGNGEYGFDFSKLISNWTKDLTLFTNGPSTLTSEQEQKIRKHNISIVDKKVQAIVHDEGRINKLVFSDGSAIAIEALYTKLPFEQHSVIPAQLGCELTETGHLKVDSFQKTTVPGVFACGDNSHPMRSVSVATAAGTLAGAMANKELVDELFGYQ